MKYAQVVKKLLDDFDYNLQRIPREENSQTDALTKIASAKATINNKMIIQETLQAPYTDTVMNVEKRESWITLIICFLKRSELSSNKKDVRNVEC